MAEVPATLHEALITLRARLPRITKDAKGQIGSRDYPYASLPNIYDAVLPLLAEVGLIWTCQPTMYDGQFVLRYELRHYAGDDIRGWFPLPWPAGSQVIGSAITYAERYSFNAVLSIAPAGADDDGAASQASYEERVAAGRMNREQMRDHGQLERDVKASLRKAERIHGPAPDQADWETPDEDGPGSISEAQRRMIMSLYAKAGITDRADRLAYAMGKLDLSELATSNELSYRQALTLIEHLEGES